WQTVRRHKLWASWFSAALALFLVEVLTASLAIVALVLALVLLALPALTGDVVLQVGWFASLHAFLESYLTPVNLLLFLVVPDYLLTCLTAVGMRRPALLLYGVGFLLLRLVDATATLWTLPQAWLARSTGRWTSPARRATGGMVRGRPAVPAPSSPPAPRAAVPTAAAPVAPAPTAAAPVAPAPLASAPPLPVATGPAPPVRALSPVPFYAPALTCLRPRPRRSAGVLSAAGRALLDWRTRWLAVSLLTLATWVAPFPPRSLPSRLLPAVVGVLAALAFLATPARRRSGATLACLIAVSVVLVTRTLVTFGP
ncbi:MAG TPA: hypothetical protein VKP11_06635, partial [Frankiaceae bacterium]|nr:hypothetical protein [Frankiaceae bacterium]